MAAGTRDAGSPSIGIESEIQLAETILTEWRDTIGRDFAGYRNHVYRVVNYCLALRAFSDAEREKVIIAACFHDLGIWSDRTADYLAPSEALALAYLRTRDLTDGSDEIALMISEHHKLRSVRADRYPLVETLRRADLIDVSLGVVKFGLPGSFVAQVKRAFPNAGFHKGLVRLVGQGFAQKPLRPLPFYKW